jgi:hypothetical protein
MTGGLILLICTAVKSCGTGLRCVESGLLFDKRELGKMELIVFKCSTDA